MYPVPLDETHVFENHIFDGFDKLGNCKQKHSITVNFLIAATLYLAAAPFETGTPAELIIWHFYIWQGHWLQHGLHVVEMCVFLEALYFRRGRSETFE